MMIFLILLDYLYHSIGDQDSKMSTNYFRNNNRPNPYNDIVSISTPEDDEDEYCPSCHCNTLVKYEDHVYCSRCKHTFDVKQVDTADIVESESMDDNPEPLVSYTEDPNARFYNRGRVQPQGAFKSLQDKGIRLTSYTERDGAGRVTSSWNAGTNSSSSSDRKTSAPRPFKESRSGEEY
jgi:hypothetical protein